MAVQSRHRLLGAGLLLGVYCVLQGCIPPPPVPVKVDDPEPFPPSLKEYLEGPSVERSDVARRLGSPDAIRDDERLWIYGRPRVVWKVYFDWGQEAYEGYRGAHHYLLVRFGDDGRVLGYSEILDEGCTPLDVCLEKSPDPWPTFPGPVDGERIVVYERNRTMNDVSASTPAGSCRMVVFLQGNGEDEWPPLAELPGGKGLRALTPHGVYTRALSVGTHELDLFEWFTRRPEGHFLFECGPGETVCLSVAEVEKPWSGKISTMVTSITWDECLESAGGRRLVLD